MNIQNPCSNDLDLAAYLDGRLSADERITFERALASNAECRASLELVRSVLADRDNHLSGEDPPERCMQKAIALHPRSRDLLDLILAFAENSLTIIQSALDVRIASPVPSALLRTDSSPGVTIVVMTKSFDALSAELHIEKLPGNTCNISIQVTDNGTQTLANNLRIALVSDWRELASSSLQSGRVLFEDIKCGTYDFIIQKNGASLGAMRIKITE